MTVTKVRKLLDSKGRNIWSISPDAPVYEALKQLADKDIGALLVVEEGKLAGIFSERDYARKVILHGKSSKDATVRDLMTRKVLFVGPDETLDTCMKLMTTKHVRHLPVLEDNRLIGIVTIGDVVRKIISDQEFTIQELEKYFTGTEYST